MTLISVKLSVRTFRDNKKQLLL